MKALKTYFHETLKENLLPGEAESMFHIIVEHLTGFTRQQILLKENITFSLAQSRRAKEIIERLKQNEPIQYILEETEFYGLKFKITPDVLIPRGETEELVDLIIRDNTNSKYSILDIGSGSGCIPITIKKHLPELCIHSCDISMSALTIARKNALYHACQVNFFEHDILSSEPVPFSPFDIIVSNPPYVCMKEKEQMHNRVLEYEPGLALFVPNNDPLLFYRAILDKARVALKPGGILYFEINEALAKEMKTLMDSYSFEAKLYNDIHGKPRIIKGVHKG